MERPQNKNLLRGGPGRPKGLPNKVTREIRAKSQEMFTPEVFAKWAEQMKAGELPVQLVIELLHYAWGKPKDVVEHQGDVGFGAAAERLLGGLARLKAAQEAQQSPGELER